MIDRCEKRMYEPSMSAYSNIYTTISFEIWKGEITDKCSDHDQINHRVPPTRGTPAVPPSPSHLRSTIHPLL